MSGKHRNPGASINFGSGLIKDVGRDGDGIYRNISRDLRIPDFLSKGQYVSLSWPQVCRCLPAQSPADRVKANIIDTVLLSNAEAKLYLYTTTEGYVAQKPRNMHDLRRIRDQFLNYVPVLQPDSHFYVAVMAMQGKESEFITNDSFSNLCLGATPKELEMLQCFMPSKGDSYHNTTFRTDFWLDRSAQIMMKTERIGLDASVSGSFHISSTSNMNKKHNTMMEEWTQRIANRIQQVHSCRVVRMTLEFVQDIDDKIWLTRSTECMLSHAQESMAVRESGSPDMRKRVRTEAMVTAAGSPGRGSSPSRGGDRLGISSPVSRPSSIGRHSEARLSRRRQREHDNSLTSSGGGVVPFFEDSSLDGSYFGGNFQLEGGSTQSLPDIGGLGGSRVQSRESIGLFNGTGELPNEVPNSRLGREVPLTGSATAMFGTTQLKGCQGDFCHIRIDVLEDPSVAGGRQSHNSLSKFRRRLMEADTSQYGAIDDSKLANPYEDIDNAAATSIILGDSMSSTLGKRQKQGAKAGSKRRPAGVSSDKEEEDSGGLLQIPYRAVIQARQEMPFVKAMLLRRKNKENADYVTVDNYQDLAVSGKLPAVYYTDVPCCKNCAQVYQIIDTARNKAMQKIAKRRELERDEDPVLVMQLDALSAPLDRGRPGVRGTSVSKSPIKTGKRDKGRSGYVSKSVDASLSQLSGSGDLESVGPRGTGDMGLASKGGSVWSREGDDTPATNAGLASSSAIAYEEKSKASLLSAAEAIEGLTKLDVAELRSMQKPPAAVEVVLEAVMGLLTGRLSTFQDTRRLLGGGEAFLSMLREFRLDDVTDSRLRMVEPYVDNPVFRPANVLPVSACAAKFCSWVLGVVQAARWQRHIGHQRTDLLPAAGHERVQSQRMQHSQSLMSASVQSVDEGQMTFVEKLEKRKAKRNNTGGATAPSSPDLKKKRMQNDELGPKKSLQASEATILSRSGRLPTREHSTVYPISREEASRGGSVSPSGRSRPSASSMQQSSASPAASAALTLRERTAVQAAQKQATVRLASQNKSDSGALGSGKDFRCRDGITKMPYIVLGNLTLEVKRCNLIIIHDFFDTCDGTAIAFKPISQRHDGCQILCFNYPGQANTVWPRPSAVERQRGAREPVLNNDWIADRLHELLQGAEQNGDMLLTNPFHLVGFGNGAAIAASFAQRWGSDPLYASSIRSVVAINGFLYPDPQLSAILHSASQLFETTPHSRPDIPVSYWARYLFSDEYLTRVNPNLALNILTAVANPITNDGRTKLARGCLQHRDLRGGLAPDHMPRVKASYRGDAADSSAIAAPDSMEQLAPVTVPVIVLQSTENSLVNASNVDAFLIGRTAKHLWSHQQNLISQAALTTASDPTGQWVGKLSKSPEDYAKYSTLGKNGLRMLLDSIDNPRGAFVMWSRAGHQIVQENKSVVLDLIDALCCPTADYFGISTAQLDRNRFNQTSVGALSSTQAQSREQQERAEEEVLFKLVPPKQRKQPTAELGTDVDVDVDVDDRKISDIKQSEGNPDKETSDEPTPKRETEWVQTAERSAAVGPTPSPVKQSAPSAPPAPISPEISVHLEEESWTQPVAVASVVAPPGIVRQPEPSRPTLPPTVVLKPLISELPEGAANSPDMSDLTRYMEVDDMVSTRDQRLKKKWADTIPEAKSSLGLERELELRHQELLAKEAALKEAQGLEAEARIARIQEDQARRRHDYENEDAALLQKLEGELHDRRMERVAAERQRKVELASIESKLVADGLIDKYEPPEGESAPVPDMRPQLFTKPPELPAQMREQKDPISTMDQLLVDEEIARKKGIMSMEEFERVKRQMALSQLERDQKLREREDEEEMAFWNETAVTIQRVARGIQGRERARAVKQVRDTKITVKKGVLQFQALTRGIAGRNRARFLKKLKLQNLLLGASVIKIQCIGRSYISRKYVHVLRRKRAAINIQRTFRGHLGLMVVKRERARLEVIRRKNLAAAKVQSAWRMKVAKEEFRSLRIHALAVVEIQRCYRGHLGRKKMKRRREWESATPGPERIKLGLQLIEESKVAFERQQEEIDALHRAQERAEARVSHIHSELKDSEKELIVLERELQEIDQIERDLQNLTHEKDLITRGIRDAAGVARSAENGNEDAILGKPPGNGVVDMAPEQQRKMKADAYALEMTIQIKRAEREKKRQELESEFATVFHDVEKKKQALERLEASLVDMESTRERKDREFRRLQQNLMQLLMEQKLELDSLREKGIELETATATSAAAATATAMKAKEHEKRSTAMFSQTEELMKFQFMSMSLSYFSSLNMLKQLRDMNADTTSAAVTSSAEAAAAAATSAIAANLPNIKKLDLKGADYVKLSAKKKKDELAVHEKAEKEAKHAQNVVMPNNVRMWTVDDVAKWMESLSLGQYAEAFREATVDGPFLLELREEDLVQVLGVSHKLHVRKILVSREKLKPLSEQEKAMKEQVEYEENADQRRKNQGVPDLETVFSQARNGRTKRLEESLNLGFPINGEDGKGNTLLLIACQNSNKRMVEMLTTRGANVNHQNAVGNTALHFCMSFDPEGQIGEYLIAHGADDTIENIEGLTPYDGLGNAGANF